MATLLLLILRGYQRFLEIRVRLFGSNCDGEGVGRFSLTESDPHPVDVTCSVSEEELMSGALLNCSQ